MGIAITFTASSAATFDPGSTLGGEVYFDAIMMFVSLLLTPAAGGKDAPSRPHRARPEGLINRQLDSAERLTVSGAFEPAAVRRLLRGDAVACGPAESLPADGVISLVSATAAGVNLRANRFWCCATGAHVPGGSHKPFSTVVRVEDIERRRHQRNIATQTRR